MSRSSDFRNWNWWQFPLFFAVFYPLCSALWNYMFDGEIVVENVITMGIAGAVIGLIIGGLVEFVRRDKAKTEKE